MDEIEETPTGGEREQEQKHNEKICVVLTAGQFLYHSTKSTCAKLHSHPKGTFIEPIVFEPELTNRSVKFAPFATII